MHADGICFTPAGGSLPMAAGHTITILELAARQHGAVGRAQLLSAGVPGHVIDRRVRSGLLRPVQRGVYRAEAVAGPHAREMTAVLACGAGALVSHRTAAYLWGLLPREADDAPIHVLTPGTARRLRPGLRIHRARGLLPADAGCIRDVPVTSVARTLVDVARVAGARQLEQALAYAEREELVERPALLAFTRRFPRRPGVPVLRALLRPGAAPPAWTRSDAEERLLGLVRRAQLRAPETNVRIDGMEVDFYWRAERLVVEVDGHAFHADARSFERDRRRDARLTARGLRVMRVTWRQLADESEATLARVAQALAR
jgi:very-short-patch-repair endonuclease